MTKNETIIALAWHLAGKLDNGFDLTFLAYELGDLEHCSIITDALEALSDEHYGDRGLNALGRIDDFNGETIYWEDNNARSEWFSDKPDGFDEGMEQLKTL